MKVAPLNGNQSMLQDYPWAGGDSIPYPKMTGQSGQATARRDMTGLFDSDTLWSTIVESANITFAGSLDAGMSDHLLLSEAKPDWDATLNSLGRVLLLRMQRVLMVSTLEECRGSIYD